MNTIASRNPRVPTDRLTAKIKRLGTIAVIAATILGWAANPVRADNGDTHTIQYHPGAQYTIYCAAAFLCEVTFGQGEKLTMAGGAAPALWSPTTGVKGGRDASTPILTVKPETATIKGVPTPLTANFVITTSAGRDYHLLFIAYDPVVLDRRTGQSHVVLRSSLYTAFAYDDERREALARQAADARREAVLQPKAGPTPTAQTVAEQMTSACQSMPVSEQYGIDQKPADFRPQGTPEHNGRPVCHTNETTYIQMPVTPTKPSELPTILEDASDGPRLPNFTYDSETRIFRIDGVAAEYALVLSNGKRIRIQRQIRAVDTKSLSTATEKNTTGAPVADVAPEATSVPQKHR